MLAEPGVYTIQVTHKGTLGRRIASLFADRKRCYRTSVLPLAKPIYQDNIVLYPNPVRNVLNIATPNDAADRIDRLVRHLSASRSRVQK
jgi:hypothetical protein